MGAVESINESGWKSKAEAIRTDNVGGRSNVEGAGAVVNVVVVAITFPN